MAAPAPKVVIPDAPLKEVAPSRRFQMPDIDTHGRWIMDRLLKVYPHKTERELLTWLRGLVYNNEFLFLYRDNGVALACVSRSHPLMPAHIQEIFVIAKPGYEIEAVGFYDDIAEWGKRQGITTLVVEELTDVAHEAIKERLGRVFTKQIQFARV